MGNSYWKIQGDENDPAARGQVLKLKHRPASAKAPTGPVARFMQCAGGHEVTAALSDHVNRIGAKSVFNTKQQLRFSFRNG